MSIPKIIHLCWFGKGAYPVLAQMCINSWKTVLPDYEIKIWNEETFDVNAHAYTRRAFKDKKWAFVSDYVRLSVLYQYGGVYMDTDLEVIKSFSHLLEEKRFVSSYIEGGLITAGFIACEPGHFFVKKLIEYYDAESEKQDQNHKVNYVMNPLIFTELAIRLYGFQMTEKSFVNDDISIYPLDYFMPFKKFAFGESYAHWRYYLTQNTYTIHHDMSSWHKKNGLKKFIMAGIRAVTPQKIYIAMKIKKNRELLGKRGVFL